MSCLPPRGVHLFIAPSSSLTTFLSWRWHGSSTRESFSKELVERIPGVTNLGWWGDVCRNHIAGCLFLPGRLLMCRNRRSRSSFYRKIDECCEKQGGGHTLCKRTSVWVKVFIWPTGFVIQRMTKSVVQTCNRYVTTQIGWSLVWFGLIVGSWYEQFQGPAVPSTLYGQQTIYVELQDQWNGPYFFLLKSHISAPGAQNSPIFFSQCNLPIIFTCHNWF